MANGDPVARLAQVLANGSAEIQLQAVLALPDDAVAAVPLLEAALGSGDPRLEVAILDALYRLKRDPQVKPALETILDSKAAEGDAGEELYMMARTAFNRVVEDVDDEVSAEGDAVVVLGVPVVVGRDELAVIVHGTWASDGTWWRSGGDFHGYLLNQRKLAHLYDDDEPFLWSGKNRDGARHDAAKALGRWLLSHKPRQLDVYAHSHGANVTMLATRMGVQVRKLVMLSPPVRSDYFADWGKVSEAYNVQASFDPVVAIARGGQWFNLPQVKELKLKERGHASSHTPAIWENNKVPEFVGI